MALSGQNCFSYTINNQKDRLEELQRRAKAVNRLKDKARFEVIATNNRYAGFAPETANSFRRMVGLKKVVGEEMKQPKILT